MNNLPPGCYEAECEDLTETRMAIDSCCDTCDLGDICVKQDECDCPLIQDMLLEKGLMTEEDFK